MFRRRTALRLDALFMLVLWSFGVGPGFAAVGVTPGAFKTNGNGGVDYGLGIQIPPGTAGVQPELNLVYNSQSGNGLIGLGWNLTGISSISRCAQKIFPSGRAGTVDYTSSDRFCVDGQELVVYQDSAGTVLTDESKQAEAYGQDGTTYRTRRETFTVFTSHGDCEGPCYFTALTKSGVSLSFGQQADARFEAFPDRAVVRSWYIDRSVDLNGNAVSYQYVEDVAQGFHRPDTIYYTHNDTVNTPAQRAIQFVFEDRTDQGLDYLGGAPGRALQRLAQVSTYVDFDADGVDVIAPKNLVKVYKLNYEPTQSTGFNWMSMLASIQECGPTDCLDATVLKYLDDKGPKLASPNSDSGGRVAKGWTCEGEHTDLYRIDFNGDSRSDLACVDPVRLQAAYVLVSNSSELVSPNSESGGKVGEFACEDLHAVVNWTDFNGDGRSDLTCASRGSRVRVLLSSGQELSPISGSRDGTVLDDFDCDNDAQVGWMDFNGDGRSDLYCSNAQSGTHTVWVSTGNALQAANDHGGVVQKDWPCALESADPILVWTDFNGDGRSDLMCSHRAGDGNHYALVSDSDVLVSPNSSSIGLVREGWTCSDDDSQFSHVDFNGDGLTDLACDHKAEQGRHWVQLSTGTELKSPNADPSGLVLSGWTCSAQLGWTDFNADGNSDLYCSELELPGNHRVMLSTGAELVAASDKSGGEVLQNWTCSSDRAQLSWVDFAASGRSAPLCSQREGNGDQYALIHDHPVANVLIRINEGPGKQVDIQYKQLSDPSIYSPGEEQDYPFVSVRSSAMTVISQHQVRVQPEAPVAFTYEHQYADAQIDRTYGWLGFARTTMIDPQNALRTITTHANRFPLLGMVDERKTVDIDDQATILGISRMSASWDLDNGVYNVWTTSIELDHYTDGTFNYTLEKQYVYDQRHQNLIRVGELGDKVDVQDDYWVCLGYPDPESPGSVDWPKSFLPKTRKTVTVESACEDLEQWNAATDLRWAKYAYDERLNATVQDAWWDTESRWVGSVQTFSPHGNSIQLVDAEGHTFTQTYDEAFHTFPWVYTTPVPDPSDPGSRALTLETHYEPAFGNKIRIRDSNGTVTRAVEMPSGMDEFGRIVATQSAQPDSDALIEVSRAEFSNNDQGGLTSTNWQLTQWPGNGTSQWTWSKTMVDGLGRTTETRSPGFDASSELVSRIDFNDRGLVKDQYLPYFEGSGCIRYLPDDPCQTDLRRIEHGYNRHGYPNRVQSPDGAVERVSYDLQDDRKITKSVPDPRDAVDGSGSVDWVSHNDSRGRPLRIIAPDSATTTYVYNRMGSVKRSTDPLGIETEYHHDSLGQVIREVSGDTGTTLRTYTALRQLHTVSTDDGRTVTTTYDAVGRPSRVESTHTPSDGSTQTDTAHFHYDDPDVPYSAGHLTSASNSTYSVGYTYDRLGHLTSETLTADLAGDQHEFTHRYQYDAAGRLTHVTYPDGSASKYTFTPDGNLNQVLFGNAGQSLTELARYSNYNANQQFTASQFANGVEQSLAYDAMGRPLTASASKGALIHFSYGYAWNKADKLRTVTDHAGTDNRQYGYSDVGRMISAMTADRPTEWDYDYNLGGDIQAKGARGFGYEDNSHRLKTECERTGSQVGCPPGASVLRSWSYDAYGRTRVRTPGADQTEPQRQYVYDPAGRLESVVDGIANEASTVASFEYGPFGPRFLKRAQGVTTYSISPYFELLETAQSKWVATRYVLGPNGPIAALSTDYVGQQRMAGMGFAGFKPEWTVPGLVLWLALWAAGRRRTRRGQIIAPTTTTLAWVAALHLALVPAPGVAQMTPGANGYGNPVVDQQRIFISDYVGSVAVVTDQTGAQTNRVYYEPYGGISNRSTGVDSFRPKFTGKSRDESIQLQYFGSRYYDDSVGRFTTPDPANQYASPYLYGDDDPTQGFDPDGEFFFLAVLVVATVIGAYAGGAIANHSANPASWDWTSGKTYVGIITGGATAVAAVALGAAALVGAGLIAPEAVAVGGIAAGAIGFGAMDVAFLTYDAYQFSQDQSVENGIFLALDLIPFAGLAAKGAKLAYRSIEMVARGSEGVGHAVEAGGHGVESVDHAIEAGSHEESAEGKVCLSSFASGSLISTPTHQVPVEEIDVGDEVLSFDEESETGPHRGVVSGVMSRRVDQLLRVETETEMFLVTGEHPFLTAGGEWIVADELSTGTVIRGLTEDATITLVESVPYSGTVHNFEVDQWHNYGVGEAGLVAHNVGKRCRPRKASKAAKELMQADSTHVRSKRKRFRKNVLAPNRFSPGGPTIPLALVNKSSKKFFVYLGHDVTGRAVYIGITEASRGSIAGRVAEHARDGRIFTSLHGGRITEIGRDLPEYAARAIETRGMEKLWAHGIHENTVRSIQPSKRIYKEAMRFGEDWLRHEGHFGKL